MGKIRRYKNSIERFLSGEKGQRFFNFAYSIGAAVVIWGALFKILHLPGGNTLLSIGMGTEVLMFILTAFDRPPREYNWEEVFPVLASKDPEDRPDFAQGGGVVINGGISGVASDAEVSAAPIIINGGSGVASTGNSVSIASVDVPLTPPTDMTSATEQYMEQVTAATEQMRQLRTTTEALNHVNETLLESYRAITENSENIIQSSTGYVEQMQSLNRNISGLNTIYEIQLKSVSSQLDAIDRVNQGIKDICGMYETTAKASTRYCEESEKMATYMQQLNQVYANMLQAMTVNMIHHGGSVPPVPPTPTSAPDVNKQA